jgi:hypothetical protein
MVLARLGSGPKAVTGNSSRTQAYGAPPSPPARLTVSAVSFIKSPLPGGSPRAHVREVVRMDTVPPERQGDLSADGETYVTKTLAVESSFRQPIAANCRSRGAVSVPTANCQVTVRCALAANKSRASALLVLAPGYVEERHAHLARTDEQKDAPMTIYTYTHVGGT